MVVLPWNAEIFQSTLICDTCESGKIDEKKVQIKSDGKLIFRFDKANKMDMKQNWKHCPKVNTPCSNGINCLLFTHRNGCLCVFVYVQRAAYTYVCLFVCLFEGVQPDQFCTVSHRISLLFTPALSIYYLSKHTHVSFFARCSLAFSIFTILLYYFSFLLWPCFILDFSLFYRTDLPMVTKWMSAAFTLALIPSTPAAMASFTFALFVVGCWQVLWWCRVDIGALFFLVRWCLVDGAFFLSCSSWLQRSLFLSHLAPAMHTKHLKFEFRTPSSEQIVVDKIWVISRCQSIWLTNA